MTEAPLIIWPIGQIAERDGVTRQAVSKTVRKLVELHPDTPLEMDARGRIVAVSVAHYDQHRERFINPARSSAVVVVSHPTSRTPGTPPAADSFEEARRQSEWIKVGREQLRHQEDIGQLMRTDTFRDATRITGIEIKTILMRLPNYADEVATAIAQEGVSGVRRVLRKIAFDVGNEIADKLKSLAERASAFDPMISADHPYQLSIGETDEPS